MRGRLPSLNRWSGRRLVALAGLACGTVIALAAVHTVSTTVLAAAQPTQSGRPATAPVTTPAATGGTRVVVPFSDPGRLGTVRVRLIQGSVQVRAGSGRDVTIDVSGDMQLRTNRAPERRSDGLRRLTRPVGVDVDESANVVSITTRPTDSGVLTIEVPARTNLELSAVTGDITVTGVEGELDVNGVNGDVTLTDVAGTIVAHSVNGKVTAAMRQVAGAPMAFTSLNGEVDVTLPAATKASLRLRSDQGDVYTDFDLQPSTASPAAAPPASTTGTGRGAADDDRRRARERGRAVEKRIEKENEKGRGRSAWRIDRTVQGTINGGGAEVELRTYNGDVFLRKGK